MSPLWPKGQICAKPGECFAAGIPLLTPDGSKPIEDFRIGDLVLSRSEDDADGPVAARRVRDVFQLYAVLLELHVGGRVIRTTAEHPFWVVGRGWTAAQQIEVGDRLLGADGEQTPVAAIVGPKESSPVYNLEIEEYHTYLVGSALWGFSAWAHNAGYGDSSGIAPNGLMGREGLAYELKHVNKHLPDTPESLKLIQKEGSAHVFNDKATLSQVEQAILERGESLGTVRGWERYGSRFDEPIGFRIDAQGNKIPLYYGEMKLNPNTGLYHVIPRTGPSS